MSAPDPAADRKALADLLALTGVGVQVTRVEVFGQGSRASAEVTLSNGVCMTFAELREMGSPGLLATEVAACSGAVPKLTKQNALTAIALVRRIARHHVVASENDLALEWCVSYVQQAEVLDLDMNDGAQRWAAFTRLRDHHAGEYGLVAGRLVLRHEDGTQFVRSGWFANWVRAHDLVGGNAVANRVARVGWERRGQRGRIKATRPSFGETLAWNFFVVPPSWGPDGQGDGSTVTAGCIETHARKALDLSRVERGTAGNRGTPVAS